MNRTDGPVLGSQKYLEEPDQTEPYHLYERQAAVKVIYSLLRLTDEHDRGPDYDPPEYLFNPKVTMFNFTTGSPQSR